MGMKRGFCLLFACIAIFSCISAQAAAADIEEQAAEIAELRATGKFDFEIPAKTLMEASTSFPMEYGEKSVEERSSPRHTRDVKRCSLPNALVSVPEPTGGGLALTKN